MPYLRRKTRTDQTQRLEQRTAQHSRPGPKLPHHDRRNRRDEQRDADAQGADKGIVEVRGAGKDVVLEVVRQEDGVGRVEAPRVRVDGRQAGGADPAVAAVGGRRDGIGRWEGSWGREDVVPGCGVWFWIDGEVVRARCRIGHGALELRRPFDFFCELTSDELKTLDGWCSYRSVGRHGLSQQFSFSNTLSNLGNAGGQDQLYVHLDNHGVVIYLIWFFLSCGGDPDPLVS